MISNNTNKGVLIVKWKSMKNIHPKYLLGYKIINIFPTNSAGECKLLNKMVNRMIQLYIIWTLDSMTLKINKIKYFL